MRVTKGGLINGGMVLKQLDDKYFIAKDKGFGVFVTEIPIRLTKHQIDDILASYGINIEPKTKIADMKKELAKTYTTQHERSEYALPKTPSRKKVSKEESQRKIAEVKNLMAGRKYKMEHGLGLAQDFPDNITGLRGTI
jgi:hypothetical protein